MERPGWVPVPAWRRLEAALRSQPEHAEDALADLGALCAGWDAATSERLIRAFVGHADTGLPLPGATVSAVSDLLEGDG